MATSKYTVEDALDVITHGDFYVVGYQNKAYIFSQELFGDEERDYGIYTVVPLSDVESGQGICLFDLVPDYFILTLIDDIMDCLSDDTEDIQQKLEKKSISECYKVLEPYSDYQDIEDYIEISKLFAGQMDFKPMSVEQAEMGEIETIKQYNEQ